MSVISWCHYCFSWLNSHPPPDGRQAAFFLVHLLPQQLPWDRNSGHLQVFPPYFSRLCLFGVYLFFAHFPGRNIQTFPHIPTVVLFPTAVAVTSTPVNASCGAGFSWLHLHTSDCIAPEQTTWRAQKFSHLSRTAIMMHCPYPWLSESFCWSHLPNCANTVVLISAAWALVERENKPR